MLLSDCIRKVLGSDSKPCTISVQYALTLEGRLLKESALAHSLGIFSDSTYSRSLTTPLLTTLSFSYSRVPFIGSFLGDEDLQILPINGKFLVELG